MSIIFGLIVLCFVSCVGLERCLTTLDTADKYLKAEYDRVDAKLHPDRKPLKYEPHVVKPRADKMRPPLRWRQPAAKPAQDEDGYVTR